jgi:uncharacterized Fe-S center protein
MKETNEFAGPLTGLGILAAELVGDGLSDGAGDCGTIDTHVGSPVGVNRRIRSKCVLVNRILLALMQMQKMLQTLQMLQTSRLWEGMRNNAENHIMAPRRGAYVFSAFSAPRATADFRGFDQVPT